MTTFQLLQSSLLLYREGQLVFSSLRHLSLSTKILQDQFLNTNLSTEYKGRGEEENIG